MWPQKYSHLVQGGRGEKALPPVRAAPLSRRQLKHHSSAASPSLSTHGGHRAVTTCPGVVQVMLWHRTHDEKPPGSGCRQCGEWMQAQQEKPPRVWALFRSKQHLQHLSTRWRRPSQISNQWEPYSQSACRTPAFSLSKPLELLSLLHNSFLQNVSANNEIGLVFSTGILKSKGMFH